VLTCKLGFNQSNGFKIIGKSDSTYHVSLDYGNKFIHMTDTFQFESAFKRVKEQLDYFKFPEPGKYRIEQNNVLVLDLELKNDSTFWYVEIVEGYVKYDFKGNPKKDYYSFTIMDDFELFKIRYIKNKGEITILRN
jgi:hypothetical protein